MIEQTKDRLFLMAENSNKTNKRKKKRAGIQSHGEDCWIQAENGSQLAIISLAA